MKAGRSTGVRIHRLPAHFYWVDKNGRILERPAASKNARARDTGKRVHRVEGMLYFIDGDGDVRATARGRKTGQSARRAAATGKPWSFKGMFGR